MSPAPSAAAPWERIQLCPSPGAAAGSQGRRSSWGAARVRSGPGGSLQHQLWGRGHRAGQSSSSLLASTGSHCQSSPLCNHWAGGLAGGLLGASAAGQGLVSGPGQGPQWHRPTQGRADSGLCWLPGIAHTRALSTPFAPSLPLPCHQGVFNPSIHFSCSRGGLAWPASFRALVPPTLHEPPANAPCSAPHPPGSGTPLLGGAHAPCAQCMCWALSGTWGQPLGGRQRQHVPHPSR